MVILNLTTNATTAFSMSFSVSFNATLNDFRWPKNPTTTWVDIWNLYNEEITYEVENFPPAQAKCKETDLQGTLGVPPVFLFTFDGSQDFNGEQIWVWIGGNASVCRRFEDFFKNIFTII